jgi:hypothetical protein
VADGRVDGAGQRQAALRRPFSIRPAANEEKERMMHLQGFDMSPRIEPVTDAISLARARALLAGVIESRNHLRSACLASRGWIAVPVESASHFDRDDAYRLAAALQDANVRECFAVATEERRNTPACYRVAPSADGLLAFSWECSSFNFALVSDNRSSVVLCTSDGYYLVAGPAIFVRRAVGGDLLEARASFERFARDASWPAPVRNALLLVAERYR